MAKKTIKGSCHCGAVKFTYSGTPSRLVSCNCSICRRYRTLWVHGDDTNITLNHSADGLIDYIWGDEELAFHSCRNCGCTTHWKAVSSDSPVRIAVNMAMADPQDIAEIPVRHFDGADSWEFLD